MKKIAALFLLIALIFVVSGCETSRGFGRDIEQLGRWMQGD